MASGYQNFKKLEDLTEAFEELFIGGEEDDAEFRGVKKPSFDKRLKGISDAVAQAGEVYSSTADALSNGVYALSSLEAGSGGSDGTYQLSFSGGGGVGAAGWFTVASGAVSAYQITARGVGYTSAPTVSFAASAGLTGASAIAVISANREVGQRFYIPSSNDDDFFDEYIVNPGPLAFFEGRSLPNAEAVRQIRSILEAYPIGYFEGGYESDLVGGAFELDEVGRVIRRRTGELDKWFIPVDLVRANPPLSESLFEESDFEVDLIGLSELSVTEDGRVLEGLGPGGVVARFGVRQKYLMDYDAELLASPICIVDAFGRVEKKRDEIGSKSLRVAEVTAVNGTGDAAWVEFSGDSYSLRVFDAENAYSGQIGSPNTNHSPELDDERNVIYVRDSVRYFQKLGEYEERPFLANQLVVGWGDSMTAAGSGYGNLFNSDHPEYSFSNQGMGGQRAEAIAARTGALPITCRITGNEIPASGSVVLSGNPTPAILLTSGVRSLKVSIGGVEGMLEKDASGVHTFTRTSGGATVTVPDPVSVTVLSGLSNLVSLNDVLERTNIFWIGRNDVGKIDYDEVEVLSLIRAAVDQQRPYCRKLLVVGVTNGIYDLSTSQGGTKSSDTEAQEALEQILSLNSALSDEYGANFIDMMPALQTENPAFFTTYNVNGTAYSVLDTTFSDDGVHGNSVGRQAVSDIIYNALQTRGW